MPPRAFHIAERNDGQTIVALFATIRRTLGTRSYRKWSAGFTVRARALLSG